MDENEKMIVCEIVNPQLRDKLLELYQKEKTADIKRECKVIVSHDFNYTHKDIATVIVALVNTDGTKVIKTIQGRDSEGCFDLTSVLQENGYKIVSQN